MQAAAMLAKKSRAALAMPLGLEKLNLQACLDVAMHCNVL